jgi:hypothetical protein
MVYDQNYHNCSTLRPSQKLLEKFKIIFVLELFEKLVSRNSRNSRKPIKCNLSILTSVFMFLEFVYKFCAWILQFCIHFSSQKISILKYPSIFEAILVVKIPKVSKYPKFDLNIFFRFFRFFFEKSIFFQKIFEKTIFSEIFRENFFQEIFWENIFEKWTQSNCATTKVTFGNVYCDLNSLQSNPNADAAMMTFIGRIFGVDWIPVKVVPGISLLGNLQKAMNQLL